MLRACSAGTVPFRSPIQMVLFLPFRNGKNPLFTVETVAERNGTVPAEQTLSYIQTYGTSACSNALLTAKLPYAQTLPHKGPPSSSAFASECKQTYISTNKQSHRVNISLAS